MNDDDVDTVAELLHVKAKQFYREQTGVGRLDVDDKPDLYADLLDKWKARYQFVARAVIAHFRPAAGPLEK